MFNIGFVCKEHNSRDSFTVFLQVKDFLENFQKFFKDLFVVKAIPG